MKFNLKSVSGILTAITFMFSGFGLYAQDVAEEPQDSVDNSPYAVVSHKLPRFSNIKIVDVTQQSPGRYRMWGYPGIWIKQTDAAEASISYNNVCTPYISGGTVGDTLVVKMDQAFLYPLQSNWKQSYGMIDAIVIEVPRSFQLTSVFNDGGYQFNTSLVGFKCKNLTITSSNIFRLLNCKIKKMTWSPVKNKPIAEGCFYNLLLKLTEIGEMYISEDALTEFGMGNNLGSKVGKYKCF